MATGACVMLGASAVDAALPGAHGGSMNLSKVVQTDDDGQKVVIELDDGKVASVTINGKKVPSARVKTEDGEIVVYDEAGKEVARLAHPGGEGRARAWRAMMGDDGAWARALADAKVADALKEFSFKRGGGNDDGQPGMMKMGTPPKVMLGVTIGPVEAGSPLAEHFGLKDDEATLITGVAEGMSAQKAGVKPFDIVISMDGRKPAGWSVFREVMSGKNPGDDVRMIVLTGGKEREVTIKLEKFDGEKLGAAFPNEELAGEKPPTLFVQPAPPAPPAPPAEMRRGGRVTAPSAVGVGSLATTARERELQKRLEQLSERLERLESLLEKLVEKEKKD